MIDKEVQSVGKRMKGWKIRKIEFRENDLIFFCEKRGKPLMRLVLKGIIGFKDTGLVDRAIANYTVTDKGSYKQIDFITPLGGDVFRATFMEFAFL